MALIKTLSPQVLERGNVHDAIDATYSAFTVDGLRYIQINSFGRSNRENPGKTSQSTQFDRETAKVLLDVIKREFGLI